MTHIEIGDCVCPITWATQKVRLKPMCHPCLTSPDAEADLALYNLMTLGVELPTITDTCLVIDIKRIKRACHIAWLGLQTAEVTELLIQECSTGIRGWVSGVEVVKVKD